MIVAIDTETGGLDPLNCALLSVSIITMREDLSIGDKLDLFILPHPYAFISPQAIEVNGYSPELWEKRGATTLLEAMCQMRKWLPSRSQPLAHNAQFDRGFLEAAEKRSGICLNLGYRWRCSMGAMMAVDDALGMSFPNYKLDTLAAVCGHWGPDYQRGDHQASADAEACAVGYRWLMGKIREGAGK